MYASPDGDDSKSVIVFRDEIPKLLNDEYFLSAFTAWHDFKVFGRLAYDGGYRDQPCQWCDAVKLFESIYNQHIEQRRQ